MFKKLLAAAAVAMMAMNASAEITWTNLLTNGDAEGEYGDIACAYSKVDQGEVLPCTITTLDGEKVFVVEATAMKEAAWDNQFWICAPEQLEKNSTVRVSFRYKATNAATIGTQQHALPGEYLHWAAIGSPSFTTDWQTYEKELTIAEYSLGDQPATMQSIAFNLNDYADANTYYFDDLKVEVKYNSEAPVPGPWTEWIGSKECNWGDPVQVSGAAFKNAEPGWQIKVWSTEASCQIILGGWGGLNLPIYGVAGIPNMTYEDGCATITLLPEYAEENTYGEGDEEKTLNVIDALKEQGLVIQGPTTITRVDVIPFVNGHATTLAGWTDDANFAPAEDLPCAGKDDTVIIRNWAGVEGYDLELTIDEDENVVAINGEDGMWVLARTGRADYPQAQIYLAEGYDFAGADEEGGYAFLSAYVYDAEGNYDYRYYYVEWPLTAEELAEAIMAEYEEDIETWMMWEEAYAEMTSDEIIPAFGVIYEEEIATFAQELQAVYNEIQEQLEAAAESWGYTSPITGEVIMSMAETIEDLSNKLFALVDEITEAYEANEAEYNELVTTLINFYDAIDEVFPGFATLAEEDMIALTKLIQIEFPVKIEEALTEANETGVYTPVDFTAGYDAISELDSAAAEALEAIEVGVESDMYTLTGFYSETIEDVLDDMDGVYSDEAVEAAVALMATLSEYFEKIEMAGHKAIYETGVYVSPLTEEVLAELEALKAEFDATTGISGIATDAQSVRYFDMNGVEVANPTAGKVYIRVANGKATKEVVK